MDSQVLAALLGALVGGLASGVAALGGSVLIEKMKLRTTTRIRMYAELLPPIRARVTWFKKILLGKSITEPSQEFVEEVTGRVGELEHISAMAGRREQRLVSRIHTSWEEPDNWGYIPFGERKWVADSDRLRAVIGEIDKDLAALEARLRKKVD